MVHHFQKMRSDNMKGIKKFLASTKGEGALDLEFRAVLRKAFTVKTLQDYLTTLSECGEIFFDEEKGRWFLGSPKK